MRSDYATIKQENLIKKLGRELGYTVEGDGATVLGLAGRTSWDGLSKSDASAIITALLEKKKTGNFKPDLSTPTPYPVDASVCADCGLTETVAVDLDKVARCNSCSYVAWVSHRHTQR